MKKEVYVSRGDGLKSFSECIIIPTTNLFAGIETEAVA